MEVNTQYQFWIDSAQDDLQSAEDMLTIKRYNWALFVGHLALEKLLKAKFVLKFNEHPPKTHNLLMLIEKIELEINKDEKLFLMMVNKFNIEARYAEYKRDFDKICTKEFAETNFMKIKEIFQCLMNK